MLFTGSFGKKVVIIIDGFEVFIEHPSNLEGTWSSYKYHNTATVLLGIAPQGVMSFVSEAWGGGVSNNYIAHNSGILHYYVPGDVIMADRSFDIGDSVDMMQARLRIPVFTKGKDQLEVSEIERIRTIANVRIHVERVIDAVQQHFPY